MDYSRLFSSKRVMLFPISKNSSYFQVTGCCFVTFVWCYSIGEMRKCFNCDLRGTSIFPQCEKGSNILATIYVCQWIEALHDFPCICALRFKQRNSILILHSFLVDMQWYRHLIAAFYLTLQQDKNKDGSQKNPIHHRRLEVCENLDSLNKLVYFGFSNNLLLNFQ